MTVDYVENWEVAYIFPFQKPRLVDVMVKDPRLEVNVFMCSFPVTFGQLLDLLGLHLACL